MKNKKMENKQIEDLTYQLASWILADENTNSKYYVEDGEIIDSIYVGDLFDEDDNLVLSKDWFEDNKIDVNEYIKSMCLVKQIIIK